MAIKRNKVKVDLTSYSHYILMGEAKIGKTTTVYELAKQEYSLDEMLLISCGNEQGYKALPDIQYEEVLKFNKKEDSEGNRGFVQVVDDLVKNYKELGIKMVVIDTLDTLFDIGIEHVMEESRRQAGKPSKSLNDCFGGYSRGRDRLLELVMNEIHKLDRLPVALFILGHTKYKGKKDTLTNDEYEQLTTNLRFDFYSPISNSAQMIVNLATERVIEDGVQVDAKRYMYFTSNGLIDCGSRFEGLPEKLELSAENFMKAFKMGVENSLKKSEVKHDIKQLQEEEKKQAEKDLKQVQQEVEQQEKEEEQKSVDELKSQLKDKLKDTNAKNIVKEFMKEKGVKSVASLDAEQLTEVLTKLQ
jgi:hypothetical protein|nr:MAG TPA: AAA domain protein [Caudoviricetes sp.]